MCPQCCHLVFSSVGVCLMTVSAGRITSLTRFPHIPISLDGQVEGIATDLVNTRPEICSCSVASGWYSMAICSITSSRSRSRSRWTYARVASWVPDAVIATCIEPPGPAGFSPAGAGEIDPCNMPVSSATA